MRRRARWQIGLILLTAGLGGCATAPCNKRQACGENALAQLPPVQRGSVESNIKSMPSLPVKDGAPVSEPPPAHSYRALTPMQCQCLAADAAIMAELQQAEADMLPSRGLKNALRPRATAAAMRRDVLQLASLEVRNRSAGSALEAYYHLAE